jgi:primosomal protein N''
MQPLLDGQGVLGELTEAHMQLAADMLLLRLLFRAKATKLTTAISEVLSLQKDVKPAAVETAEAHVHWCEERIMAQITTAMNEVAALWNPLESRLESL